MDTTRLTPADLNIRTTLAYADISLELGKFCSKCQQFIPGVPNACGTCKIVNGPTNPKGTASHLLPSRRDDPRRESVGSAPGSTTRLRSCPSNRFVEVVVGEGLQLRFDEVFRKRRHELRHNTVA